MLISVTFFPFEGNVKLLLLIYFKRKRETE
jgi:hypothetical protein